MAFKTMFNPKAFSPQTVLTQDVGTRDTRLYVDDVSVFPAAPTLATIGTDSSTAETVKVTAIGSNFVDVERGYVGSAKAFTANTVIARNFSSADQQIIQDNLNHLNDVKLEEVATDDIIGNAVTNAKLAQIATSTIKGRRSSGTGAVEDLTAEQVREIINVSDGADKTSSVIEAAANVTIADDDAIVIIDGSASVGNKTKSVLWSAIKAIFAALYVPLTRTVNGKALSDNISLSASDVGADASGTASTAVSNHNSSSTAHSAQFGSKQDKITASGILVGDGENVTAYAADATRRVIGAANNPNLLDNWDFRNPVNQRGKTSYPASGYTIDRWRKQGYTDAVITLTSEGLAFDVGEKWLGQYLDMPISFFNGNTFTASVMLSDGTILQGTRKYVINETETATQYIAFFTTERINSRLLYYGASGKIAFDVVNVDVDAPAVTIAAVKLELGSVSTLADDPPMDYAAELLKCQRYYENGIMAFPTLVAIPAEGTLYPVFFAYFKVRKRTVPTIVEIKSFADDTVNAVYNSSAGVNVPYGGLRPNANVDYINPTFQNIGSEVGVNNKIVYKWTVSSDL